ncbi:hypothetical protein CKO51_22260 [Rhodopirellula sp. SM50]|nr:hypothetical protein CKO51_22260 [Rhodopirellula sp. SM50]
MCDNAYNFIEREIRVRSEVAISIKTSLCRGRDLSFFYALKVTRADQRFVFAVHQPVQLASQHR